MSPVIIIIIAVVAIAIIWWIATMNGLRRLQVKIEEALSGIDVALTKRFDALTKMADVAKSYAKFEKETILGAVKLRGNMSMSERNSATEAMNAAQKEISILAEAYPQLGANENFRQLQVAVMDVEEHLQAARRMYNSNVSMLNQRIVTFPTSIVANSCGITRAAFYEAEATKRNDVNLSMDI